MGLFQMWLAWRDVAQLPHTELMQMVDQGKVASVTITETTLQGRFKEAQEDKALFISSRVDPEAAALFEKAGSRWPAGRAA